VYGLLGICSQNYLVEMMPKDHKELNKTSAKKLGLIKDKKKLRRVGQTSRGKKYRDYFINKEDILLDKLAENHLDYYKAIADWIKEYSIEVEYAYVEEESFSVTNRDNNKTILVPYDYDPHGVKKVDVVFKKQIIALLGKEQSALFANIKLNKEDIWSYERIRGEKDSQVKASYWSEGIDQKQSTKTAYNPDKYIQNVSRSFNKPYLKKLLETSVVEIKLFVTHWDFFRSLFTRDYFHTDKCSGNKDCKNIMPLEEGIKLLDSIISKCGEHSSWGNLFKQEPFIIKVKDNKKTIEDLVYDNLLDIEKEYKMMPFMYKIHLDIKPKENPFW